MFIRNVRVNNLLALYKANKHLLFYSPTKNTTSSSSVASHFLLNDYKSNSYSSFAYGEDPNFAHVRTEKQFYVDNTQFIQN